jgi:hypothetical protein
MSLIFKENTYFTKNIYVNTIDISNTPILYLNNMSLNGDISTNNVNVSDISTNTITTNSTLLNIGPIYNNSTKLANSIGYYNTTSNTVTVNYTAITSKQSQISISSVPAGVYIINYSYVITTSTTTSGIIMNVYEYLDTIANSVTTNIIQKGKSIVYEVIGTTGNQNETTFGVLTEASNQIVFSLQCTNYNTGLTVQFSNFAIRYTRLA